MARLRFWVLYSDAISAMWNVRPRTGGCVPSGGAVSLPVTVILGLLLWSSVGPGDRAVPGRRDSSR